jgi:thiol-disulfide isomerase/thioredoxin
MKTSMTVIILALTIAFTAFAADNPIAGKSYTLTYDPAKTGILMDSEHIRVIYAFDYWGTKFVQKLRGEPGESDLFNNVLDPDEGRAFEVDMVREGNLWHAEISIPEDAALLSYYFTDGERSDYNDRKTYVSYVYNETGNPVRDARFRNVDFLFMAEKELPQILDELGRELNDYPDHFIAHVVYWRFRFFDTVSPDTLKDLLTESGRHFADVQKEFGDTVLNYRIMSLDDINRVIYLSLRDRGDDPAVRELQELVHNEITEAIQALPREKMTPRIASRAQYLQMAPEERERLERESRERIEAMMAEFVGEPAPDFPFETIDGEEYRLSDFRGRYVLLDFWGSWCGPCVQEIPNLVQIWDRYGDRDFVMISISNDASANNWSGDDLVNYTTKREMHWPQVLDDANTTIHKLYNIQFWPNMFLIDKEGNVLQRQGLRGEELFDTLAEVLGDR